MSKLKQFLLFIILFSTLTTHAQRAAYFKRVFVDAEYYLLYEEYMDALPLYKEILRSNPSNANINYRIGQCYLYIPDQKEKAIPFLEEAIKDVTTNYQEGYFTEEKAPREAYLMLGKAYRIQSDFDKALQYFSTYLSVLKDDEKKEKEIARKEIEAITFAKRMKENPVNVKITNAGRFVNTRFNDVNPLVSGDNRILIYTVEQQFYNAIMMSIREGDDWKHPINLNSQLLADGPIHAVGLSTNGKTLLLARLENDLYNLYISNFDTTKNAWETMVRLPREVNSRQHWENYASLSPTGDTMYISSNRPGGSGGFDIYYSVRTASGWSNPENMGKVINTSFDEIAPQVSRDGKKLYFASKGHATMGGFDIFVSYLNNGTWSKPLNLGYPINTPDDDIFFSPIGDGSSGYMSKSMPRNFGGHDIYLIEFDTKVLEEEPDTKNGEIPFPVTQGELNPQANSIKEYNQRLSIGR